jgi:opacity protein-like surface antigen
MPVCVPAVFHGCPRLALVVAVGVALLAPERVAAQPSHSGGADDSLRRTGRESARPGQQGWSLTIAGGRTFSQPSEQVYEGADFPERLGGGEDGQHYAALGLNHAFRLPARIRRLAPSRPLEFRVEALFANARSRVASHYMMDDRGEARHALRDQTFGASAAVAWPLGAWGKVQPFLLGGLGVYHKRLGSNPDLGADEVSTWVQATRAGWQAGLGLQLPVGRRTIFLEARTHRLLGGWSGSNVTPVALGIRF